MKKNANAYAIVMAGGKGERFWPQSRLSSPKQLLRLLGNLTLIEQTIERLSSTFLQENILIVTNEIYMEPMRKLIPSLPSKNIVGEPCRKDTAPCIAAAGAYVKSFAKTDDPVLCFFPSDHIINDTAAFAGTIQDAAAFAEKNSRIVTIGIKPDSMQTGYGYMETGASVEFPGKTKFHEVRSFMEKPDAATAEKYIAAGNYKWNAGIFCMKCSVLEQEFAKNVPVFADFMQKAEVFFRQNGWKEEGLAGLFRKIESISIDYAIMEKTCSAVAAEAAFDWADVGSWTSLRNQDPPDADHNIIRGLHKGIGTKNCIISGDSRKLIATIDVQDLVIVDTPDALLVCDAKSAQKIKELVNLLADDPKLSPFV